MPSRRRGPSCAGGSARCGSAFRPPRDGRPPPGLPRWPRPVPARRRASTGRIGQSRRGRPQPGPTHCWDGRDRCDGSSVGRVAGSAPHHRRWWIEWCAHRLLAVTSWQVCLSVGWMVSNLVLNDNQRSGKPGRGSFCSPVWAIGAITFGARSSQSTDQPESGQVLEVRSRITRLDIVGNNRIPASTGRRRDVTADAPSALNVGAPRGGLLGC